MHFEIGTWAAQFLFWEFLFPVFGIVSLQCGVVHNQGEYCSILLLGLGELRLLLSLVFTILENNSVTAGWRTSSKS